MPKEDLLVNIEVDSKGAKKGVDELSKSFEENSRQTQELDKLQKSLEKTLLGIAKIAQKTSSSIDNMNMSFDETTETAKTLGQALTKSSSAFRASTKVIQGVATGLNTFAVSVNTAVQGVGSFINVISLLLQERNLLKLANLLRILGSLAAIKGHGEAAARINLLSKSLLNINSKVRAFHEQANLNFQEYADSASRIAMAFEFIKAGATGATLGILALTASGNLGSVAKKAANLGKVVRSSLTLSFLSVVEASTLLGPVFQLFGSHLEKSENSVVSFSGKIIKLTGLLMTSFAGAIAFILSGIGAFIQGIGESLITSTHEAEKAFQKLQVTMSKFTFAIKSFGKAMGVNAVGSLEEWNEVLEETDKTTTFTRASIAKAIKLIVVEGAQLGITVENNKRILATAGDVAALTGNKLQDVTQAIVSAMNGSAVALANMGINLTKTALGHSKLAKSSGLLVEQMSEQEIVQLRVNELLKQGSAFSGAAADEINTVAGALAILNKVQESNMAILGEQNDLTRQYIVFQIQVARFFNELPPTVLQAIGAMKDFLGVTLTIIGAMIKYTFAILGLILAFRGLSVVLLRVFGLSISLAGTMTFLLTRMLPIIIAVQLLFSAFKQLAVQSGAMGSFLDRLSGSTEKLNDEASKSAGIFTRLGDVLKNTFQVAVDVVKLSVVGLVQIMLAAQIGIVNLKKAFADSDDVLVYDLMLTDLKQEMASLEKVSVDAVNSILSFGEQSAMAAGKAASLTAEVNKSSEAFKKFKEDVKAIAKTINESFDVSLERTKIFGDEFAKAGALVTEAKRAIDAVFDKKGDREETAKRLAQAQRTLILAQIALEKLHTDKIKEFSEISEAAAIQALRAQGKNVQAIKAEMAIRLKAFDVQVAGMKEVGKLSKDQLAIISETRDAIENSGLVQVFEEQAKAIQEGQRESLSGLQRLTNATKNLGRESILFSNGERDSIRMVAAERLADVKAVETQLKLAGALNSKRRAALALIRQRITSEESLRLLKSIADKKAKDAAKNTKNLLTLRKALGRLNKENLRASGAGAELAMLENELQLKNIAALEKKLRVAGLLSDEAKKVIEAAKGGAETQLQIKIDAASLTNQLGAVFDKLKTDNLFGEGIKQLLRGGVSFAKGIRTASRMLEGIADFAINLPKGATFTDIFKEAGKTFAEKAFTKENLAAAAGVLGQGLVNVFDTLGAFFDPAVINGLAGGLDFLSDLPDQLIKAFDNLIASMDRIIDGLIDGLDRIISKMPEIIAKLVAAIPKLISAIMNGLVKLFDALPQIFAMLIESLPEIFSGFLQALPAVISSALSSIGKIVAQLIANLIPDLINELFANLPAIIEALVEGVIAAMGDIVAAIIDLMIGGGLEKIIGALLRAIPKIIVAIVVGVAKGLQRAMGSIFGGIQIPTAQFENAGASISEGFKAGFDKITGETSKLFSVKDFEDAAAGLSPAEEAAELGARVMKAFTIGTGLLQKAIDFLVRAWRVVFNFFKKIGGILKKAWSGIIDFFEMFGGSLLGMLTSVGELFKEIFNGVAVIFQPIIDFFMTMFGTVISMAFQPIIEFFDAHFGDKIRAAFRVVTELAAIFKNAVKEAFTDPMEFFTGGGLEKAVTDSFDVVFSFFKDDLGGDITSAFQATFDKLSNIGTNIGNSFMSAIGGLGAVFSGLGQTLYNGLASIFSSGFGSLITGVLSSLSPNNLMSKIFSIAGDTSGKGSVEKIIGLDVPFVNFASGGMIGGIAKTAGDSIKNDTIPIMASPGEFIVPRSLTKDPNVRDLLENLVSGRLQGFAGGGLLGSVASSAGSAISDAGSSLPDINLGGLLGALDPREQINKHITEALRTMMQLNQGGYVKAIQGGLVGGFSSGDGTKALLQPGEFVTNRTGVQALGLDVLGAANKGRSMGGSTTNMDVKLTVNTTEPIDDRFIRNELLPSVKEELKEASLRGEFLMSRKGLRE